MDNTIKIKLFKFYEDNAALFDIDVRMSDYLFSEIYNDLKGKGINTFGKWLNYYSTNGNNFYDVVVMSENYYYKALKSDYNAISLEEKILVYNAIALYAIEMDVDKPKGKILGTIINTFIEVVHHYNLLLKKYLLMDGEILISDRNRCHFYSLWTFGSNIKKEMPVTLFAKEK